MGATSFPKEELKISREEGSLGEELGRNLRILVQCKFTKKIDTSFIIIAVLARGKLKTFFLENTVYKEQNSENQRLIQSEDLFLERKLLFWDKNYEIRN